MRDTDLLTEDDLAEISAIRREQGHLPAMKMAFKKLSDLALKEKLPQALYCDSMEEVEEVLNSVFTEPPNSNKAVTGGE